MSSRKESVQGTIVSAEIAVSENDPYTAEEALQKALRLVREQQQELSEKSEGGPGC